MTLRADCNAKTIISPAGRRAEGRPHAHSGPLPRPATRVLAPVLVRHPASTLILHDAIDIGFGCGFQTV
jgi:hypothetical protein